MKNKRFLYLVQSLPQLMRLGVTMAVTFSTATGYIVIAGTINSDFFLLLAGVFLLSGGASALNQYQERETDVLMSRTCKRPIPSGKISALTGLLISLFLTFSGLLLLLIFAGYIPALLGLFNMLWYNGFYTYLKKKTAFAVVPGSLTGVTPVVIGWSAGGGSLIDPVIVFIAFFLYLWQIPHFWLLLIRFNNDYKKAGLGSLSSLFTENQSKRVVYSWVIGTTIASLFFPYFGIIKSNVLIVILLATSAWLSVSFYRIIFEKTKVIKLKKAFIVLNAYMIIVLFLLILEFSAIK
ncbi:MAG: protoheme IX farnesyltransferase [Bacteroidota bacterium]